MCSQPHASITGSPKATTSQPQAWSWPLSAVQPGSPGPPRRGRLQVGGRGQEGWDLEKGCAPRPPQFPRQRPCLRRSPKTKMFLPDGSLDLARVDTSLRIEDLWEQRQSGQPRGQPGPDRPTTSRASPAASRSHHRLWPSSSSLVRSPAAPTAGPLGPSSSFFSNPTGAILPTAATKRALPRARRGPARTLAGPPAVPPRRASRRQARKVHATCRAPPGPRRPQAPTGAEAPAAGETGGRQAATGAAMRREAVAGEGAAREERALAASAGRPAQQHPP